MPERRELLERFPALATYLHGADADAVIAALAERDVAAGAEILSEGKAPGAIYLVWEGALGLSVGEGAARAELGTLGPGALVGEVSFLDGGPASATLVATAPTELLVLERGAFEGLARSEPRAAAALLRALCRVLASHVREATDELERLEGGVGAAPPAAKGGLLAALKSLFGMENS